MTGRAPRLPTPKSGGSYLFAPFRGFASFCHQLPTKDMRRPKGKGKAKAQSTRLGDLWHPAVVDPVQFAGDSDSDEGEGEGAQ
jgi:hypothetical protein